MILSPLNDETCLGAISETVRGLVTARDPELLALAQSLNSTVAVIRWLRSLPQRDDVGEACDGPRVDVCAPPQRLRLPAPDPNCVERAALYVLLGEFLAPEQKRRLATIDTPVGRHTLPLEDDQVVVLDPRVPRNGAQAGADRLMARPALKGLRDCAAWVGQIAAEPAARLPGGPRAVRNGNAAMIDAMDGRPVPGGLTDDVAMVLALAAREAPQWGPAGVAVVRRVADAMIERGRASRCDESRRNAIELRLGRYRLRPAALVPALRALGALGVDAGTAIVRAKLATLGVTPEMLGLLESELNREGISLGAIARPVPPLHSFAALTKDAVVARHLERAGAA
ncbi:MAG TPA: hypothetical protein VHE35_21455 [Kofleriaceae bacterium]|nr:hypothetical protein [Kofleriaceae bacterium]